MKALCSTCSTLIDMLQRFVEPLVLLGIRLQVAYFFWKSGKLKLDNYLNDSWEDTVSLFRDIHPVPGIPAEMAAPMAMVSETLLPVMLAFGLLGRGAALGLLGVAGVIYITHEANIDMLGPFREGAWVALLLLVVLIRGAGPLSIDKLLLSRMCRSKAGDQ